MVIINQVAEERRKAGTATYDINDYPRLKETGQKFIAWRQDNNWHIESTLLGKDLNDHIVDLFQTIYRKGQRLFVTRKTAAGDPAGITVFITRVTKEGMLEVRYAMGRAKTVIDPGLDTFVIMDTDWEQTAHCRFMRQVSAKTFECVEYTPEDDCCVIRHKVRCIKGDDLLEYNGRRLWDLADTLFRKSDPLDRENYFRDKTNALNTIANILKRLEANGENGASTELRTMRRVKVTQTGFVDVLSTSDEDALKQVAQMGYYDIHWEKLSSALTSAEVVEEYDGNDYDPDL